MVLATERVAMPDNGLRNYLRRVPPDSVLYHPGLEGGGATVLDYSGYAHNGTITGAQWTRLSSGLWALTGDGDDYVTVTRHADLEPASITFMLWMNMAVASRYILSKEKATNISYGIDATGGTGGACKVLLTHAGGLYTADGQILATSTWYHIAGTYDGTNLKCYVNGALKNTTLGGNAIIYDNGDLDIGYPTTYGAGFGFNGKWAIPKVLSTALTLEQIRDNHFSPERRFLGV